MRTTRAFTIIELLTVIAIIAILMAVLQPMLAGSSAKTREFECESNLKHVGMALHIYAEDYSAFPTKLEALDPILQDRNLLRCPNVPTTYCYLAPGANVDKNQMVAACLEPEKARMRPPHRLGTSYLSLSAGGEVTRIRLK